MEPKATADASRRNNFTLPGGSDRVGDQDLGNSPRRAGRALVPLDPKLLDRAVPAFERLFRTYFSSLEGTLPRLALLKLLQAHERESGRARRHHTESVAVQVDRLLRAWLREQRAIILDELVATIFRQAVSGFRQVLEYWGERCGVDVAVRPEDERRLHHWSEAQATRLLDQVNETTRKIVRDFVNKRLAAGDSPRAIVDAVLSFLADRDETRRRARLIARTESTRVLQSGGHDVMRLLGSRWKRWETEPLCDTCPICLGNEQQRQIPLDRVFSSGHLTPPAHPNCCCALAFSTINKLLLFMFRVQPRGLGE